MPEPHEAAEMLVEIIRDELRTISLALTPTEREARERIVELWEAGKLDVEGLADSAVAIWSDDWPETAMTRFIRKVHLDGVPFPIALREADEETKAKVAEAITDWGRDG